MTYADKASSNISVGSKSNDLELDVLYYCIIWAIKRTGAVVTLVSWGHEGKSNVIGSRIWIEAQSRRFLDFRIKFPASSGRNISLKLKKFIHLTN